MVTGSPIYRTADFLDYLRRAWTLTKASPTLIILAGDFNSLDNDDVISRIRR